MFKPKLNCAEVGAGGKHMCGGGMAEQVGMDATFDAGPFASFKTHQTYRAVIERRAGLLPGGEQPVLRPVGPEVNAQPFQQRRESPIWRGMPPLPWRTCSTMRLLSIS